MRRKHTLFSIALLSCSDPVTSGAINALPGEDPNIPIGEFHRAGQPCVVCHDPSGPASSSPFALAGTVFAQPQNTVGVDQATVAFTDSSGSSFTVQTNCVGNFFVWRPGFGAGAPTWNPEFPIFVRIFKNGLASTMQGQIGRERSCANCHYDADPTSLQIYSSAGHLHLYATSDTPPPPSNDCPVNPVLQ
jgi:hypothetical protein